MLRQRKQPPLFRMTWRPMRRWQLPHDGIESNSTDTDEYAISRDVSDCVTKSPWNSSGK
jgi:hypothetical protein